MTITIYECKVTLDVPLLLLLEVTSWDAHSELYYVTVVAVVSQQSSLKDALESGVLRTTLGLAWADLYNRWSVEMEYSIRSPGEIRERRDSLPVPPVVWSALILLTVFTFLLSFVSPSFWKSLILMACWVDTASIWLQHPGDRCMCACWGKCLAGQCDKLTLFFFLRHRGNVRFTVVTAAATVRLIVSASSK